MTRFKKLRPNSEVRLRKWPAGRVAQLKLFLGHLENAINTSLAAQVLQSSSRKFSEFVPIVPFQNIRGQVEFREIRIELDPPKGLRDFLFYEYQISKTVGFFQFDQFTTPEPSFVFADLEDAIDYFIRLRVVTKSGFVGPFSDTFTASTPFAKSFQFFDGTELTNTINAPTFQELFNFDYDALGGDVYYGIQYEVEAVASASTTNNITWSDLELRWLIDGDQLGQNMRITVYRGNIEANAADGSIPAALQARVTDIGQFDTSNILEIFSPFSTVRRGSLVQKVTNLIADTTHTFSMEGRVRSDLHPTPNDFIFTSGSNVSYGRRVDVTFKNFSIFEVIAST